MALFRAFPVGSTNIFPITNSTAGGQLLTEFNLRSRESIATSPQVTYMIGPSYTHSKDDFSLDKTSVGSTVLNISSGKALINGHYVELLVPISIDIAEANAKNISEGMSPLKGKLCVGIRAMYNVDSKSAMVGSIKAENNSDMMYDGIQIVILPEWEGGSASGRDSNYFNLPEDVPNREDLVTAHIKLGTFRFANGAISDIRQNDDKIKIMSADRLSDIQDFVDDTFINKTGLQPNELYVFANKGIDKDTWCRATDSLVVWDNDPTTKSSVPGTYKLIDPNARGEGAKFITTDRDARLYLPHKQVDGTTDPYIPVHLKLPIANYDSGSPGIVNKNFTDKIKDIYKKVVDKIYTIPDSKYIGYIESISNVSELPDINPNWEAGYYILVGSDQSLGYSDPPVTMYMVKGGVVQSISPTKDAANSIMENEILVQLKSDLDSSQSAMNDSKTNMDNSETLMNNLDTIRGRLNSVIYGLESDSSDKNLNDLANDIDTIISDISSINSNISTLSGNVDKLSNSENKTNITTNISSLSKAVKKLYDSSTSYSDIDTLNSDINSIKSYLKDLLSYVTGLYNSASEVYRSQKADYESKNLDFLSKKEKYYNAYITLWGYVGTLLFSEPPVGVELKRIEVDEDPGLHDIEWVKNQFNLDAGGYNGTPYKDYFTLVYQNQKYYYVTMSTSSKSYSNPIILTKQIGLAEENIVGGFYNVPDDNSHLDNGYVYLDETGHLRLMDYTLLRSGVAAYQLGQDITIDAGLTTEEVQLYVDDYINDRIAFPNSTQMSTNSSNPYIININITLQKEDSPNTLTIKNIDSRFGTAIYLHINGNADKNTTINIQNCQKIRIDSNIGGYAGEDSNSISYPIINIDNCCLYYDVAVMDKLKRVYGYTMVDGVNTPLRPIVDGLKLWYERYDSGDPKLLVDNMTVIDEQAYTSTESVEGWTETVVNDYHYYYSLKSLTFGSDGSIIGCQIMMKNSSTVNIVEGKFIISKSVKLPQGAGLQYADSCLSRKLKVTGNYISSYPSGDKQRLTDTNFTFVTQSYDSNSDSVTDGSIAILADTSWIDSDISTNIPGWSSGEFHIFSGGVIS